MKRSSLFLGLLMVLSLFSTAVPARAASQITSIQLVNVQVFATANCDSGDHIVDFGIVVNGTPGSSGSFTLNTVLGGSGTPETYTNSVPDSRLGVSINTYGTPGIDTWFNGTGWTSLNGTAVITVTADGVGPATVTINCVTRAVTVVNFSSGAGAPGPAIPSGFVLKTLTCNVAVFDAPGGKPVGSNAITSGQTWYVNPTPKKDAAGKLWTEIFVAGYSNGYVPTSCVH
jgi:hypothetical protein